MPSSAFARPDDDGASRVFDAAEKNLVLALSGECALAIEKERLIHANAKIRARVQQEKLHADVLRTFPMNLRTPLTSIYGNAAMLSSNADCAAARSMNWPTPLRTKPVISSTW